MFDVERRVKLKLIGADLDGIDNKHTNPPSEKITRLLKDKPMKRTEIEKALNMSTETVKKCLQWMYNKKRVINDPKGYYSLIEESDD